MQNCSNNFRFKTCKYKTPKRFGRQIVFGLFEEITHILNVNRQSIFYTKRRNSGHSVWSEPKRAKEGGFMSKETIVTTDNPSILIAKKHFENKNVRFRVPDRNEN